MPLATDRRFSREAFESAQESEERAAELSEILTRRLTESDDMQREIQGILADLRALGHELTSWDESDDFVIWGGDYTSPRANRMIVDMRFGEGSPVVAVSYGPWPQTPAPPTCVQCGGELAPTQVSIEGCGHGIVDGPATSVIFRAGRDVLARFMIGMGGRGIQMTGFRCRSCGGLWISNPTTPGWTGGAALP